MDRSYVWARRNSQGDARDLEHHPSRTCKETCFPAFRACRTATHVIYGMHQEALTDTGRELIHLDAVLAASIAEIAAMKAYTMGRRTSLKDYADMYALLELKHIELPEIIQLALLKYKSEFNDRLFLEQLIALDDVEDEEIQFLKTPVHRAPMQEFF